MAANHPICHIPFVCHLRKWFQNNAPNEWPDVYDNLKEAVKFPAHYKGVMLAEAFIWETTPQGKEYWSNIQKRVSEL